MKSFDEIFVDKTKYGTKVKTDEYHDLGKNIIIDQGQKIVAGYTDFEEGVFEDVPAIIFGDHTRIIKYVDKPFFLGADGVKVLKSKIDNPNYKYLYYALKNAKIPDTGYNRHFKWLKEINIRYPDVEEQKRIVSILDKISNIIEARKYELEKLDNLIKSRFVEMFGDPMTNSKGYELKTYGELFELNAGGTPSKQKPEYWDRGTISWIGSNMCRNTVIYENDGNYITEEGLKHSSARLFPIDTVLVALVGATIGKTALLKFETTTNQNVLGIRGIRKNGFTPEFVFFYTQGLYQKFLNIGDGGFAMASKGFVSELPMPIVELTLQKQFATFVNQVDKLKFEIQKALEETQTLMDSLMQQYFG